MIDTALLHTPELWEKINLYNRLSKEERDEIVIEVLNIMEPYIYKIAYSYSIKTSKIDLEDFLQEGRTVVIKKLPKLKLNPEDYQKKQLESFMSYWVKDACQNLYARLGFPCSMSASGYKKASGEGTIIVGVSLEDKPNQEMSKTYEELLPSSSIDINKKIYKEDLRKILDGKFGEGATEDLIASCCYRKGLSYLRKKRVQSVKEYIRNDELVKEILIAICE